MVFSNPMIRSSRVFLFSLSVASGCCDAAPVYAVATCPMVLAFFTASTCSMVSEGLEIGSALVGGGGVDRVTVIGGARLSGEDEDMLLWVVVVVTVILMGLGCRDGRWKVFSTGADGCYKRALLQTKTGVLGVSKEALFEPTAVGLESCMES